jgi:hypothetical protein
MTSTVFSTIFSTSTVFSTIFSTSTVFSTTFSTSTVFSMIWGVGVSAGGQHHAQDHQDAKKGNSVALHSLKFSFLLNWVN